MLLLPAVLLLGAVAYILHKLYTYATSPLRHVPPVHWSSPFLPWHHYYLQLDNRLNNSLQAAHERHGPVVRLAPTTLSFCSATALKSIYTTVSLPKPAWYSAFKNYGIDPMFTMLTGKPHAARKKVLAHFYTNSNISKHAGLKAAVDEVVPALLRALSQEQKEKGEVDVWPLMNATTMDLMTPMLFTRKYSTRFIEHPATRDWFLKLYHCRKPYFVITSTFPSIARWVSPKWVGAANDELESWCARMVKRAAADPEVKDCVTSLLVAAGLPTTEVEAEVLDHLGAGHETTGIALSFTFAALSTRRELQERLYVEGKEGEGEGGGGGGGGGGGELLEAVLRESLRLYTPIPGPQPRIVPEDSEGVMIDGIRVPAGTIVEVAPWTIHRDALGWGKDAAEFRPERWLREGKIEGERWWWAFGSGSRGCIGRWLAMWELRRVVGSVVREYVILPPMEGQEKVEERWGMKLGMEDGYSTAPEGGKVRLRFVKRERG